MSRYQPYPSYKDSGVEWLGEVPEEWEVWKIAHAFKTIGSGTTPSTAIQAYFEGSIPWVTTGELRETVLTDTSKLLSEKALQDYSALTLFPTGSIVMAMYGATIGRLGILGTPATTNQACCVLTNSTVISNMYLYYWLMAFREEIVQLGSGGGQPNISQDKIINLKVSAPSYEEQTAITNFLDHETTKIDTLIAKQERMIELLGEKRSALISHAVTKGIDPNVAMKDSGVEWLGEIPKHWEIIQSRRLFSERKERAQEGDEQLTASQKYGIISQQEFMELEGRKVVQVITGSEILKRAYENDFIISMRSFQGGLEWCKRIGSMSSAYIALIPIKHVTPQFFVYLFKSKPYIQALQSTSNLVRDGQALRFENFSLVDLVIIPDEEQRAIADYLDNQTTKIDTLIAKARQAIELMKERRTALISAAVTGKIDVREIA